MALNARYPGQYEFEEISLVVPGDDDGQNIPNSSSGIVIDIRNVIDELSIYEDLYSNTLTGFITFLDGYNLPEVLGISSREYIRLTFRDKFPFDRKPIELIFSVTAVSERALTNEREQLYTLTLASTEAVRDKYTKLSKSYSGFAEEIVEKIYDRYLDIGKELIITDKTKNPMKMVVPYWSPFQTINWIAQRSISLNRLQTGFFFFERMSEGFTFTNLEHLISRNTNHLYQFTPGNVKDFYDPDIDEDQTQANRLRRIESYTVLRSWDNFENMESGMWANRLLTVDATNKTYREKDLHYIDHYNDTKTPHMEEQFDLDHGGYSTGFYLGKVNPLCHFKTASNSKWIFDEPRNASGVESNYYQQWYQSEKITTNQLDNFKLAIHVHGDSTIGVGDKCDVAIPAPIEPTKTRTLDEYLTGRYIVTSIRHIFKQDKHMMAMELAKDSLPRTIKRLT